jgi:hypothetical protein
MEEATRHRRIPRREQIRTGQGGDVLVCWTSLGHLCEGVYRRQARVSLSHLQCPNCQPFSGTQSHSMAPLRLRVPMYDSLHAGQCPLSSPWPPTLTQSEPLRPRPRVGGHQLSSRRRTQRPPSLSRFERLCLPSPLSSFTIVKAK